MHHVYPTQVVDVEESTPTRPDFLAHPNVTLRTSYIDGGEMSYFSPKVAKRIRRQSSIVISTSLLAVLGCFVGTSGLTTHQPLLLTAIQPCLRYPTTTSTIQPISLCLAISSQACSRQG